MQHLPGIRAVFTLAGLGDHQQRVKSRGNLFDRKTGDLVSTRIDVLGLVRVDLVKNHYGQRIGALMPATVELQLTFISYSSCTLLHHTV